MLIEDMLQPLLQQMFKMASHFTHTSPKMLPHQQPSAVCQTYSTQMLLQMVFQKFQKSFKVVFVYPFVENSFTDMLASNCQIHADF